MKKFYKKIFVEKRRYFVYDFFHKIEYLSIYICNRSKNKGVFMEYTKDIILDLGGKGKVSLSKSNKWTSTLKQIIKNNKFIITIMTSLLILTAIDIVLVNSFIKLLANF